MAFATFSVRDRRRDRDHRGIGAHLQVLQAAHDAQVRWPSAAGGAADDGGDEDGSSGTNRRPRWQLGDDG